MTRHARTAATTLSVVAAVGAAALAWGALVERNRFTIRYENLPVLDPGARPITVLHLSDMHMAPWQRRKQDWVRSLAMVEPDLIVNTGDNLGHVDGIEGVMRALGPFAGVPGVYVNGSNDYFGPSAKNPLRYLTSPSQRSITAATLDTAGLESYFQDSLGWLSLNNAARALELKGSRLEFFGVNDAHRGWDRLDRLPGVIEEMRENVGWQDDRTGPEAVPIGVTHAPYRRVLDSFVTNGAEVILAGHTHGGQVRIPGLPALVTNCDIPREQAQGLSVWHHARRAAFLNVSAGLGTSIYAPVRFACPPEAVVITLVPGDDFS
ncbi:MAG: metallophosphoesterase [Rhodoglobus sp.]|nr:metallophosphoesterase [Rhodoglobus sp.]